MDFDISIRIIGSEHLMATPSRVRLTLYDEQGTEVASKKRSLDGFEPFLRSIDNSRAFDAELAVIKPNLVPE
jgi:hypothetical protein